MDDKTRRQKLGEEQNIYIVSKYLLIDHLLITKAKKKKSSLYNRTWQAPL